MESSGTLFWRAPTTMTRSRDVGSRRNWSNWKRPTCLSPATTSRREGGGGEVNDVTTSCYGVVEHTATRRDATSIYVTDYGMLRAFSVIKLFGAVMNRLTFFMKLGLVEVEVGDRVLGGGRFELNWKRGHDRKNSAWILLKSFERMWKWNVKIEIGW